MPDNALFYENAVAVSPERHRTWHVDLKAGFAFARRANAVPITTVEFDKASRRYPIVFVPEGDVLLPTAILGLHDRENLFIADDGRWTDAYVPAYVRRYPFVFATSDDGRTFTVCIDESFVGCNQEGMGERLFLEGGERSPYLNGVLAFLQEYQAQYRRTREFSARLKDLGLLEPMQANVSLNSGERHALGGFMTVNRDRLKALGADAINKLLAADLLELAYLHLFSLANFADLVDRLADRGATPSGPASPTAAKPSPGS